MLFFWVFGSGGEWWGWRKRTVNQRFGRHTNKKFVQAGVRRVRVVAQHCCLPTQMQCLQGVQMRRFVVRRCSISTQSKFPRARARCHAQPGHVQLVAGAGTASPDRDLSAGTDSLHLKQDQMTDFNRKESSHLDRVNTLIRYTQTGSIIVSLGSLIDLARRRGAYWFISEITFANCV